MYKKFKWLNFIHRFLSGIILHLNVLNHHIPSDQKAGLHLKYSFCPYYTKLKIKLLQNIFITW